MGTRAHGIAMILAVLVVAVASLSSTRPTGFDVPINFPSASPPASRSQCLPIDPEGKADSKGITAFGMDVFRELAKEGNVFFSPFNLWTALALAFLGAEKETSLQLGRLLGLRGKRNSLDFLNGLERELSGRFEGHKNLSLEAASRVYLNDGFAIDACLHSSLSDRVQTLDFSKRDEAAKAINRYVNAATKGLIPTAVSADQLVDVQMAIVSAIYFYGTWQFAFDPASTTEKPFYPDPNSQATEKVEMMYRRASFLLGESDELSARVVRLPYTTGNIAMYVLLPTTKGSEGFDATVRALNPTTLQGAINGLAKTRVRVMLPKFKMEGKYQENLKQALKKLGATHMFDPKLADFSLFSSVFLSTLVHKAVVDVSEVGTEAAAVTVLVGAFPTSLQLEEPPFICDRPFIFIIYDDLAQVPLFMGAYKSPPRA